MENQTIATIFQTLSTAMFFLIAGMFLGRKVRPEYKRPTIMFGVWWAIMGIITANSIIQRALFEENIFVMGISIIYVELVALSIGIFGLLYYTLFLFTGKEKLVIPLAVFYVAVAIWLVWMVYSGEPYVVKESTVIAGKEYAPGAIAYVKPIPQYMSILVLSALVLPQIIVCIALYSLYFKLDKPTQKYRVFMIATGILVWFGSGLVANAIGISSNPAWASISKLISVLAVAMVYLAYKPPYFAKKKYGLLSIDDERLNSVKSGGE
ncbi:MAG: hypothetical protein PHH26_04475 [Candidatus Thermoplasmatota archaeon]|nr:hypothetical protein [Candidatus Thermoplasmatota archaeon]